MKVNLEVGIDIENLRDKSLKDIEKIIISEVLEKKKGSKRKAAKSLGITKKKLKIKMSEHMGFD